jgi:hypothetical protein
LQKLFIIPFQETILINSVVGKKFCDRRVILKKTLLWGGISATIISLILWGIFGPNKVFTLFMYVILGAIILSVILSGALLSGDRIRANYHTEAAKDRNDRNRLISRMLIFVSPYAVIAFIIYLLK